MGNVLPVHQDDAGAGENDAVSRINFMLPAIGHVDGKGNALAHRRFNYIACHAGKLPRGDSNDKPRRLTK